MTTAQPQAGGGSPYDLEDPQGEYRRLHRRIVQRRRRIDRHRILIGIDLWRLERHGLHQLGGYTSLADYARAKHDFSAATTSELKSIGRGCVELPGFREALEEERLSFSAAREVVRVARPETAQEWIEKASRLSLEELAAEVQGVSPLYTRRFQLTSEQLGLLDDLLTVARKALGTGATNGELLAEICRRAACGAEGRGPVVRTSFVRCPDCDATHRQTSAGAVPVEPAVADAALCNGEVLDLQTGRVSRRIPSPARRTIEGQHGGRCAVPGCRSRVLEAHHEDGWVHGHDPSRCLPLCRAHHKQRHQGWLRLETVDGEWRFYLEDGTFLGRAGADHKATDRLSRAPAVPVDRPLGSTPTPRAFAAAKAQAEQVMVGQPVLPPVASVGDLVRDAVSALRGLELRKREAEGLVRFALAAEPKREWRLEDLVGEALRAMPTAHLTG